MKHYFEQAIDRQYQIKVLKEEREAEKRKAAENIETLLVQRSDAYDEIADIGCQLDDLKREFSLLKSEKDRLEFQLPETMHMRDVLQRGDIIKCKNPEAYLRLTEAGVLQSYYEDAWVVYPVTFESLTADVLQGRKVWEICHESPVEIALLTTSKL